MCPRTLCSQSEGPGDKAKPSVYNMIALRSLFVVKGQGYLTRSVTECMKEIEYGIVDFLMYSVKTIFDACTHSVSRVLFSH